MSQTFDLQNIVAENVREIGEGAMRELKAANEALTKRVAELKERDNQMLETLDNVDTKANRYSAQVTDLKKRVAELEQLNAVYVADMEEMRGSLLALQSQLAWTPVAQGLPTEPGRYQFIDDINFKHPEHGEFPHYWRKPTVSPSDSHHWFLHHGRWFGSPLDWCKGYTYWRKVEVPTRPITLPEAT